MHFRPCIDLHNGAVKQLVGGSLREDGMRSDALENYRSTRSAAFYADLYRQKGLSGGHVILLNKRGTQDYEADLSQAREALYSFPGGLQAGGGITPDCAAVFLDWGASHVIVTSYLFEGDSFSFSRLEQMEREVGRSHLTVDLSCRKKGDAYFVVTDRWQTFTNLRLSRETLEEIGRHCGEFLIHGVDVEGTKGGVELDLVRELKKYRAACDRPVTYAGGIGTMSDLDLFKKESDGILDVTVGSALDLFGGSLPFDHVCDFCAENPSA